MTVYGTIRQVDPAHYPVAIGRDGGDTLVCWDPRATRLAISTAFMCLLTDDERHEMCAAFGVIYPLPDWTLADRPAVLYVPPSLRLPGATAFQGGDELARRAAAGDLELEVAAYLAEIEGRFVDLQEVDDSIVAA